jgi:NTP pyrophosphatase (non-canonical NTP hydrolase)
LNPCPNLVLSDEKRNGIKIMARHPSSTYMPQQKRQTDFESVTEFNRTFGVPVHEKPQWDIFDRDPMLVQYRLSLIKEELSELEEAVRAKDLVETIDALADLIYVVQGMGSSLGLDVDRAFDIVHRSNMSKVCKTEDEARETVAFYEANKDVLGYDSPAYRKSPDGKHYVVDNQSTMKVLKSIHYTPAKFDWLNETSQVSKVEEVPQAP